MWGGLRRVSRPAIFLPHPCKKQHRRYSCIRNCKGGRFYEADTENTRRSGLLYCSAWVFGLAGTVLGIFGVLALITHQVTNGIILLVMAFLVSPFGIPMATAWLISKIQDLRYAIQDRVYG